MIDLSTATPLGTTNANATALFQDDWTSLIGGRLGDGVLWDTTGTGWEVAADGSSTTITVKPNGAVLSVAGVLGSHPSNISLDLAAVGTTPTSGQTRRDLIVARRDLATRKVSVGVLPGTPASSGATDPTLLRSRTGSWDFALARITRLGNIAPTQAMVTRLATWASWHLGGFPSTETLPGDAPIGATATVGGDIWERVVTSAGTVTWTCLTAPGYTGAAFSGSSGNVAAGTPPPKFQVSGGRLYGAGQLVKFGGGAFPTSPYTLGTILSPYATGLSATRFATAATNSSDACRIAITPGSPGAATLTLLAPAGVTVVVLDGWSVPLI